MCFVWIWEQTVIISLYSINWLVFVTETECLLRGTDWVFIYNSTFCPHNVFMCFVWIWEKTAIISLYNINWLVFITETECVYCAVRTGSLYIILRSAHTVYLCVLCGSENKQRLFPYTAWVDAFVESNAKLLPATLTFSCPPPNYSTLSVQIIVEFYNRSIKVCGRTEVCIKWCINNQQFMSDRRTFGSAVDSDLPYFLKPLTQRVLHENKNVQCKLACSCNTKSL